MKKKVIKIEFGDEKLLALKSCLEKKNTTVEDELNDALEKLYEKYVSVLVREFIELKEEKATTK